MRKLWTIRYYNVQTHTHTRLTALCPGLPRWAGTRKVKPIWILLKQETVSGCGISWAICKSTSLQTDNHDSTPPLSFLQAGCPSCRPTNSVKALKASIMYKHRHKIQILGIKIHTECRDSLKSGLNALQTFLVVGEWHCQPYLSQ